MNDEKNRKFISERILGRDLTFGRALKFIAVSLLCGAFFGGAAFGVYYLAHNKAESAKKAELESSLAESERAAQAEKERKHLRETRPAVPETSPQESPEESQVIAAVEETEETSENAEGEEPEETLQSPLDEAQTGYVREVVSEELENYPYSREDLERILDTQTAVCADISRYIVKVSCYISETTWFESTVETERNYAGIIVSKDEEEILVLTVDTVTKNIDSLKVTFFDGSVQEAEVKKTAGRDGWTVLTVEPEGIPKECLEELEAAETVSPEELAPGMPVITAGAPMGVMNSFGFGYISYVEDVKSEVDGSSVCCCTEAQSNPALGTFLMTEDSRFVGMGTASAKDSEAVGNRFLVAESCSVMLENLKKGNDSAWLGITGTDIRTDNLGRKIPEGMYVTDVEENGPAFTAGLKRGDIIVNIGSREIKGLSDYCNFMRNLRPEETIRMTVMREAIRSEYKELEMEMTAGTR